MPGRHSSTETYAFGFQGQRNDNEIKGTGNSVNYKYRMHDPRLGRFFAVDPLANKYPYNSPYAFCENFVINGIELEGLEVGAWASLMEDEMQTREKITDDELAEINYKYSMSKIMNKLLEAAGNTDYPANGEAGIWGGAMLDDKYFEPGYHSASNQLLFIEGLIVISAVLEEAVYYGLGLSGGGGVYTKIDDTPLSPDELAYVNKFIKYQPAINDAVYYGDIALPEKALLKLSEDLGGVEVAQFKNVMSNGTTYYTVARGTVNSIDVYSSPGQAMYLMQHIHPSGNQYPSASDIDLLFNLQNNQRALGLEIQTTSNIVTPNGTTTTFSTSSTTVGN